MKQSGKDMWTAKSSACKHILKKFSLQQDQGRSSRNWIGFFLLGHSDINQVKMFTSVHHRFLLSGHGDINQLDIYTSTHYSLSSSRIRPSTVKKSSIKHYTNKHSSSSRSMTITNKDMRSSDKQDTVTQKLYIWIANI